MLRFLPEVADDAFAACAWYEAKAPGLGEEFLRVFYAGAGEISEKPQLYRKVYGEFRRCLLRRFPYAIYFRGDEQEVIVFGLFHCARDPRMIRSRLRERREASAS